MEKRYLTAGVVERTLRTYEDKYGMPTSDFYEAHLADDPVVAEIPRRHRAMWASMHRTLQRMLGGGSLAARIERELEPA